ncbi:MAG TPA: DUF4097 family beta strand repeat-containing protein [Longimicrobium sp.]|nr:DUF4097 family beta strand repeat-containing protein [Longimicrobium sp.]
MIVRKLVPVAAVCALALGVTAMSAAPAQQREFDWDGEIAAGRTLRVFASAGTITVRAASGSTARVRAETVGGEERDIAYSVDRASGDVLICARYEEARCTAEGIRSEGGRGWSGRRRARANFTIEVPRGVLVRVGSGNGEVAVDGATADVHASSGNGDVRVGSGAARVNASTGNGDVAVDGARAAVDVSTGNGRVTVSTAAGPVEASTGNGEIAVSMASVRGDGDMRFSSGNGSVTLTLPAGFGAELDASTGNGRIESDFPIRTSGRLTGQRVRGTLGDGGRNLRISTGNGRITLRRG